jgi:hypothetical protein
MPTAYVHLPHQVSYRREAFINGFARLGYIVHQCQPPRPLGVEDVAVIWNRTARSKMTVDMAKIGGGAVIVAENGYWGQDAQGRQAYALALDGHCGSGRWYAPPGDDSRLQRLQIDFKPFRTIAGERVVIAGQRGIGSEAMRSPPEWDSIVAANLQFKGFEALVRPHPGVDKHANGPLMDDLADARCLVVWSSNCATEALIEGVPVFYDAPAIVTAGAARPFREFPTGASYEGQRQDVFERLAWAQWFVDEIDSGEALRILVDVHAGRLPACQRGLGL